MPCNAYDLTLDANGRTVLPFAISRDVCTYAVEGTDQMAEHRQVIADFKHQFAGSAYLKGQVGWSKSEADWRGVYIYNFFGPSAPNSYVYGSRERNELETYDVELDFGSDFEAFGRQHTFLVAAEYRTFNRDIPTYQYVYYGYVDMFAPDFSFIDFDDPASIPVQDGYRRRDDTRLGLGAQVFLRATDRVSRFLPACAGARSTSLTKPPIRSAGRSTPTRRRSLSNHLTSSTRSRRAWVSSTPCPTPQPVCELLRGLFATDRHQARPHDHRA